MKFNSKFQIIAKRKLLKGTWAKFLPRFFYFKKKGGERE